MGGARGEIRGKSKIEVYLEYKELCEDSPLDGKDPDPSSKKFCKSLMEQDPETEEWVLQYHLYK